MAFVTTDSTTAGIRARTGTCTHDEFDSNLNSILNALQEVMGGLKVSEKAFATSSSSWTKDLDLEGDEFFYSPPSTLVVPPPTQHLSFTGSDDETSAGKAFRTTDETRDQTAARHGDTEALREVARLTLRLNQREGEISTLKDKIIRLEQCHFDTVAAEAARALQKKMEYENTHLRKQIQELHNSELTAAAVADENRNNIPSETPSLQQRLECTEEERNRLWADVQHLHDVSERQRHEVDASQRSAREAQVAHNELKLRLVRLEDETISLRKRLEASGGHQCNNVAWKNATQCFVQEPQDTVTEMILHVEKLEKETFSLRRRLVTADEKYFSEKNRSIELESRVNQLQEELTQKSSVALLVAKKVSSLEAEREDLWKEILRLKNLPEMDNNIGRVSSLEAALKGEKARAAALAFQLHSFEERNCPGTATSGTPYSSHVALECRPPVSASSKSDEITSILQQLEMQKAASSRLAALIEDESLKRKKAEKRLGKVNKSAEIETAELQRKLNAVQSEMVEVEESFDVERKQYHESSQVLKQDIEVAKMTSEGLCVALEMVQEDLKTKEQSLELSGALLQKLMLKLDDSQESLEAKVQGLRQELINATAQLELMARYDPPRNLEFETNPTSEGVQINFESKHAPLKEQALEGEIIDLRHETALLKKKLEYFTSMEQKLASAQPVFRMSSNEQLDNSFGIHFKEAIEQQGLSELPKRFIGQLEKEVVDLKVEEKTLRTRLDEALQRARRAEGEKALAIQQMDALRESLVAETQWSSAQEKEMKRLYAEFKALQEGIKAPMIVQQNRITDLQEANIVLIRGLNSAKEEAEVLRQELSNSMETKEDVNALLRDLETSRKDTVCSKRNVAELQANFQAKCEEIDRLKLNFNGNIEGVHDLCASRETELIGQVERLRTDLNAEIIKHRLAIEVNENLEQATYTFQREIDSLKKRLQHELAEQSIQDSVDGQNHPPISMPYSEGGSRNNNSNGSLMEPHIAESDDLLPTESSLSLGELVGSQGLVVQTWRRGFRRALSEMDRS